MGREEGNFDDWLSAELHRELGPYALRPAPAPRYRFLRRRRWRRLPLFAGPPAAVALKAATGLVVTAFAVAATGAALTGSANPVAWGAHARAAVSDCKADLHRGQRAWGDCASSVAGQVPTPGPEPVIAAPAPPQAASPSRIDDAKGPGVKTAPPPAAVNAGGKKVTPPKLVKASPTPATEVDRGP